MPYLGGKAQSGTYQRIINLIPPHDVYIEPFLGSGAIARMKRPARLSYGVDLAAQTATPPAGMTVVRGCGLAWLEEYDFRGGEFVYCDPPYLLHTRRSHHRYEHELDDAGHERLLGIVKELPCAVMISGYPSVLYTRELAAWNSEEFQVMTRGHTWATEVLWYNYTRPSVLHDLRYVGANYRERLRIRRKRERWRRRLERLPALERAVLFSALVDVMDATAAASAGSDAVSSSG